MKLTDLTDMELEEELAYRRHIEKEKLFDKTTTDELQEEFDGRRTLIYQRP